FRRVEVDSQYKNSYNNLLQIDYAVEDNFKAARMLLTMIYGDSNVSMLRHNTFNPLNFGPAYNAMIGYQLSMDNIESIYIYNSRNDMVYTTYGHAYRTEDFFDKEILDELGKSEPRETIFPFARTVQRPDYAATHVRVYTLTLCEWDKKELDDAIILNMNEKWLENTISRLVVFPDSKICVTDRKGDLVFATDEQLRSGLYHHFSPMDQITDDSRNFIYSMTEDKALYTYLYMKRLGWYIFSIVPVDTIMNPINRMQEKVAYICMTVLASSLLISWILSWLTFRPVKKMIEELELKSGDGDSAEDKEDRSVGQNKNSESKENGPPDTGLNTAFRSYQYPYQNEEQLANLLICGKAQEAEEMYHAIITSELEGYSDNIYHFAVDHVCFAVIQAAESADRKEGRNDTDYMTWREAIKKAASHQEIDRLFIQEIREIGQRFGQKNPDDTLILDIENYIAAQLSDNALCPEKVAEQYDFSAVYLNRKFKKVTGVSLANYIIALRLNRMAVLLLQSNESVGRIIDSLGFLNRSYAHTLFKKAYGVTPNEYRMGKKYTEMQSGH
ncbi:MAG TPA: AraC family transcriptional regulator, partial [Lachnospiraceae bacterium]|nr:AraC family transcriptional regulator [Lachnospiraceae bacterium]